MLSPKEMDQKFNALRIILKNKDKASLKMDAHGGYSILFVYPPTEERLFLERIRKEFPGAYFIDIAKLFIEYIDAIGCEEFFEIYEEYSSEPEKLFKSESNENDLYMKILREIEKAGGEKRLPILIRTGSLYGTGIENIHMMDSMVVQDLPLPLIIMYPATVSGDDKLRFLNCKLASDYRAAVIY